DKVPRNEWPPLAMLHVSFDVMVGAGSAMGALAILTLFLWWRRKRTPEQRWLLWAWTAAAPLGLIAMEAGWCVTELGRQPWIVRGFMRTREAVTPFEHLQAPFWTFGLIYIFLG